jgi:DeoR family transcriptional regulator, suf operon transcriptional repressor
MQQTRQRILVILRENGHATVDDVVLHLQKQGQDITPVTVRHHLTKLQEEGFVALAEIRHRDTPGRPQHIYTLSNHGVTLFPNNYKRLAEGLLVQLAQSLPNNQVNVIIEGVADAMATEANIPNGTLAQRLDAVIDYLNAHGYDATWETLPEKGYLLHTRNCPYHALAKTNDTLCAMDMQLIAKMLGVVPRLSSHMAQGDETCSYFIPEVS